MADYPTGKHKGKVTFVSETGKPYPTDAPKTWYYEMKVDENGTTLDGTVGWNQNTPRFKKDDEITYDKELDAKNRIKFKNTKLSEGNKGPSGEYQKSTYNDPLSVKHTGMSMAQMCVNDMFIQLNKGKDKLREMLTAESTPEEIAAAQDKWPRSNKQFDAYAMKFYLWIINGVEPLVRDTVTNKGYCVQRAISQMSYKNFLFDEEANKADTTKGVDINSSDDILKQAEHLFLQQQILT